MTNTLHVDPPVLGAAMSARQQLAAVMRWARTAGWQLRRGYPGPAWGWYAPAGDAAVELIDDELVVHTRYGPGWRIRIYPVSTIREGIEQLVTLGLLPPELSPVYASGYGAGWRANAVRQDTAVVAMATRCGDLVQLLGTVQVAAWCLAPGDPAVQLRAVRDALAAGGLGDPAAELAAAVRELEPVR